LSDENDPERRLGKGLATATGGALIGAAIGGPVGAVIGGAVGPLSDYLLEARKRQLERARALALRSSQLSGLNLDEFLVKLSSDERLSDIGLRLLEVAAKSDNPDRDNAMAMLLAEALTRDAATEIDGYEVLAEVLADLRRPHIDVLMHIFDATRTDESETISPKEVVDNFPNFSSIIRTVIRTLELHGLILDENRLADPPSNEIKWRVSELGEALASIVRSAQEEVGKNE